MEITQWIGYLSALIIGLVLGLVGGGGSILTVPVFAYLFYINPVTATAYSLFPGSMKPLCQIEFADPLLQI